MFPSFSARAVGLDRLSAADTITLAAGAGFAGVDFLVRDLVRAGEDPDRLRRLMDRHGLRPGAWHLPVRWREGQANFEQDLAELPQLAAAARQLGLTRTGTAVLVETGERTVAETTAMHLERLGTIARILEDHGTRLGLEVIGVRSFRTGHGEPFVTRLADLEPRLGAIWGEAGNLGVLVDAFHLYAADEPVDAGLAWGVDRVVWVHVADLPRAASGDRGAILDHQRGLPGEHGAVECAGLLDRLETAGYDGPVTVETLGDCRSLRGLTAAETAAEVAKAVRRVWPGGAWR